MTAIFHEVRSETTPGVTYIVREMPDGTWGCSCPAFAFKQQECKHIRKIKYPPEKKYGKRKLTWSEMLDDMRHWKATADPFEKSVEQALGPDKKENSA